MPKILSYIQKLLQKNKILRYLRVMKTNFKIRR